MIISQQGMILRMRAGDVRAIGRATQGVRLIEMEEGDEVVAIAKLAEKEDDEDGAERRVTGAPDESAKARTVRERARSGAELTSAATPARASRTSPAASSPRPRLKRTVIFMSSLCSSTDDDRADAELRVPHAHARTAGSPTD